MANQQNDFFFKTRFTRTYNWYKRDDLPAILIYSRPSHNSQNAVSVRSSCSAHDYHGNAFTPAIAISRGLKRFASTDWWKRLQLCRGHVSNIHQKSSRTEPAWYWWHWQHDVAPLKLHNNNAYRWRSEIYPQSVNLAGKSLAVTTWSWQIPAVRSCHSIRLIPPASAATDSPPRIPERQMNDIYLITGKQRASYLYWTNSVIKSGGASTPWCPKWVKCSSRMEKMLSETGQSSAPLWAVCAATRDEEQAVSMPIHGPCMPSQYDTLPLW